MKNQALFSSKDICKKLKCRLLQFLFGTLRVKYARRQYCMVYTEYRVLLKTEKDLYHQKGWKRTFGLRKGLLFAILYYINC